MDCQTLAAELNGSQYPLRISKELKAAAKAAGLVIVYGASDDLMELDGSIYDEMGCYEGGLAYLDAKGLLPERENIEDDEELQDYFTRKPLARSIEALWCKEGNYSWTYRTDIPHLTFEVLDGEDPYCRGLVFALSDLN